MRKRQNWHTYPPTFGSGGSPLGWSRWDSGRLVHLGHMKPSATHQDLFPDGRGTLFEPALSLSELAEQLHVSVQTLYDLRSQGRGPTGFRVGRHLRFRHSEIQAWLQRLEAEDLDRHPTSGQR